MIKNIILDTDFGADCDDIMALTYLAYHVKKANINLTAITHSHVTKYGAGAIKSLLNFYGVKIPPVGSMVGVNDISDYYCEVLSNAFSNGVNYSFDGDSVSLLRKTLANSNEKQTIVAIGPLTNISALFNSQKDAYSNLNGIELVKQKCNEIILMAGKFVDEPNGDRVAEWNVK